MTPTALSSIRVTASFPTRILPTAPGCYRYRQEALGLLEALEQTLLELDLECLRRQRAEFLARTAYRGP
jgi:hypothetical protein